MERSTDSVREHKLCACWSWSAGVGGPQAVVERSTDSVSAHRLSACWLWSVGVGCPRAVVERSMDTVSEHRLCTYWSWSAGVGCSQAVVERSIETYDPTYQSIIGQAKGLSFRDVQLANLMYNCSASEYLPACL